MKAIVTIPGQDTPRLEWREVPDVEFGDQEVLVDVRATAVNRADLLQARGLYPPPPGESSILGLEMSGVVAETGASVQDWKPGDRVCALLAGGGYAERVPVHQDMLIRIPASWSFNDGAAIPEVWLTAFVNLFLEGELKAGETVLIHAGASGVGTAAIQLARENGSVVFSTAGTDEKVARCKALGAAAINYKKTDYGEEVTIRIGAPGVDLILDPVGGPYLERNLALLKEHGRLVIIGALGGPSAVADLGAVLSRSIRIIGSRLRPRALSEKIEITRAFIERFWPDMVEGRLVPVIDRVFSVEEAEEAHRYVQENRNIGKVILEIPGSVT